MSTEEIETNEAGLDDRDEMIMACLMGGMTHADAAAFLGISTKTVHRRVDNVKFQQEHARRWSLVLSQATDGISALIGKATEGLSFLLDGETLPALARGIDLTFKWAAAYLKQTNQDARISRIEGYLRLEAELDAGELQ